MKYGDKIIKMQGVIIEVKSGSVAIDFKGRLGSLTVPKRMVICEQALKVGQEVALKMSFIEVLSPEVNQKYLRNIERSKRVSKEDEKDV